VGDIKLTGLTQAARRRFAVSQVSAAPDCTPSTQPERACHPGVCRCCTTAQHTSQSGLVKVVGDGSEVVAVAKVVAVAMAVTTMVLAVVTEVVAVVIAMVSTVAMATTAAKARVMVVAMVVVAVDGHGDGSSGSAGHSAQR